MTRLTSPLLCLALCLGLMLGFTSAQSVFAADKIGEVGEKQGETEVLRTGATEQKPIEKGDPVELEDKITTKAESKIWLRLVDDSQNSLGEDSIVYMNDFGSDGDSTYFHGHAEKGAVRYIKKLEITDPKSTYVVTTPTALITVKPTEKPADFIVRAPNEFQTEVTVIWGKVTVKNILEDITEDRTLRSCQRVYVDAGKKPSPKYWVSSDTLQELIELTTIPYTLPEDIPDCEPREARCPCPWGFAKDFDGECKPCAFYAGAIYDPELCRCICPCPPGTFPDPIDGECLFECPSRTPVRVPGILPPNPNVLPHTGCPTCDCCPFGDFCTLSFPGDPTCPYFRCGDCGGPPGPGLPPFVVPPIWGDWYDCAKCCMCDTRFGGFGNPCGLNAAGFPTGPLCGPGPRCISRSQCLAHGGYFVRTEFRFPFGPCWVCQPDPPKFALKAAAGPGGACKECKKLTYKNSKAECVPVKDGSRCYKKGACGKCVEGECTELPPCPKGQQHNAKCECVEAKPPTPPEEPEPEPEPACETNSDCRKLTKGQKPCCIEGECRKLNRCPNGTYRCVCEEVIPPPPEEPPPPEVPPGVVEPEGCDRCEVRYRGNCVPCSQLNMQCNRRTGRCMRKPIVCGRCEVRWQGRCMPCRKLNMACNKSTGKCFHKPTECGRCQVLYHGRCVPCDKLNMKCRNGRCVHRPTECGFCEIRRHGRCVSCRSRNMACNKTTGQCVSIQPQRCPSCTERAHGRCVPCAQLGKVCYHGRCAYKATPSRPPAENPALKHPAVNPGRIPKIPQTIQPQLQKIQPGTTTPQGSKQLR